VLQSGLARLGHYTRLVDGDFGGGTEAAVKSLQIDLDQPPSGRADPGTWQRATGLSWPVLFERCLQLTARFEGHGYRLIAGNFDGAGLTWGIIGFTLKHGEVQAIINELAARAPKLLDLAFGDEAAELMQAFHTKELSALMSWADSISRGAGKQLVAEPWRTGFATLGAQPLVQEIQRRRAREKYFDPALVTAARLGFQADRSIALCFDVHVQNGGVKTADAQAFKAAIGKPNGPSTERTKCELLAKLVANSAKTAFRADVLARKSAIASGEGIAHGQLFRMDDWGLGSG
jgi:Putative peptidoglycan binding domain/Glycosyl hydrolase family 46